MIRPKFICNNCAHKSICKYKESMTNFICDLDTTCRDYDDLPVDTSAISCYHFQKVVINKTQPLNSEGVIK